MPVKGRQTITEKMAARKALKEAEAARRADVDAKQQAAYIAQSLARQRADMIAHLGVAVALHHAGIHPRSVAIETSIDPDAQQAVVRYVAADGALIDIAELIRAMPYVVSDDAHRVRFVQRDAELATTNP